MCRRVFTDDQKRLGNTGLQMRRSDKINLSCGFCPFPDTEVAHDPGDEETQGQVPVKGTNVVNTRRDSQCSSPAQAKKVTPFFFLMLIN